MTPKGIKPVVPHTAIEALDIRVGTIVRVEDVPKAAKLVLLTVDLGDHTRGIVAGLKQERANPKEIEGKQCLFVVNLEPRTIMGQVSEGMLFDIGHSDGLVPCLAMPERPVPNGTQAG